MPATNNLLSHMIEYTGNVIIGSGGLDMLIPTNGTLLVLQNVTWGGVQGFQRRSAKPVSLSLSLVRIPGDYQR
jgi:carboxypeptidase D